MRILITGASGFIGSHIASALLNLGHEVIAGVRRPASLPSIPGLSPVTIDFVRQTEPEAWLSSLKNVDAVVNCVGIIAESSASRFDDLHRKAPIALFRACALAGVRKVVQISALGADDRAFSRYHLSKKAADDVLAGLNLDWTLLQPSLVYGPGGQSTALLSAVAALPVIPLIGDGRQRIQPVYVDDLVRCVVRLLEKEAPTRLRIPAVGPNPITLREFLSALRRRLGMPPAPMIPIPYRWMLFVGDCLGRVAVTPFNGEALRMLQQGNTGDPGVFSEILGTEPKPLDIALAGIPARRPERLEARLFFVIPALRHALALLWIWSGLTSALFFPKAESFALLAPVGITGAAAAVTLYGASLVDTLLGVALFVRFRVRWVGTIQMLLMLAYSIVIGIYLPEFWLHPYAPIAKNIPLIAATLAVMAAEEP
jgi:uncharacterized protein YbjT (DUF2867 family)